MQVVILDKQTMIMKVLLVIYFLLSSVTIMSQDWANLSRFKQNNDSIMKHSKEKSRIVFMGNSITEGWLHEELDFFDNPKFINRGISGQTTSQMLVRFRQDVVALKPKAVVILAGINDIAENTGPISVEDILGNIKSMCDLAKANNIKVVLCSVLPAKEFPWRMHIDPKPKVKALNNLLKMYSETNENIFYVDYYEALVTDELGLPASLTNDEVHLTLKGYRALEPMALNGIEKAIKD
jgi:lysophospholipase L1-like esterase